LTNDDKWQNLHGARFAKTTANCSSSFCHFHLILSVSRWPQPVVSSNEVSVLRYCTWVLFLKIQHVTSNEVILRSNVLLRYFHFVAKYFVTF
jgi:hypothetical protein